MTVAASTQNLYWALPRSFLAHNPMWTPFQVEQNLLKWEQIGSEQQMVTRTLLFLSLRNSPSRKLLIPYELQRQRLCALTFHWSTDIGKHFPEETMLIAVTQYQ